VALAFTIAVALGSALLFGAWPARQAIAQVDLASRFREESGTVSAGGARQRSRNAMVMVQLALATTLLVGAGLLLRSFQQMSRVDLGVSPGGVLTFAVGLPKNYDTPERRAQFVQDLDARLAAMPGATSAGATFFTPFTDFRYNISLSSQDGVVPSESEQARLSVQVRLATPDWFRTMGISLVSGRVFTARDRSGAAPVAMLNQSAARLLWPATDPMGHRLTLGTRLVRGGERINGEVIGVVKDVREFGPTTPATPTVYFAYDQWPVDLVGFAVRGADASQLLASARSALVGLDPNVPMYQVRTLEQLMGGLVARPRLYSLLLSLFAGAALLLAAIGVYGVLAAAVAARSREIGVRIALGAERLAVLRDVMLRAWLLALGGVGAGLTAALALGRAVRSLLFDITPADPVTFALVIASLAAVTLLAAWGPAWRAARVDPMVVLRAE
jgi:putative ABC transport system permease protein